MKPLFDFSGRDIWVIGGAGYLGTEVVKGLVAHGASVLCADLPGRAAERIAQERLPMEQVRPADIDAADCEALPAWIANEIGRQGVPHGLVIMTFRSFGKKVVDLLPAEFDEASHVGLTATFLLAREVGEAMANEGRGSIVLFSSMYGTVSPDPAIYHEPLAQIRLSTASEKRASSKWPAIWPSIGDREMSVSIPFLPALFLRPKCKIIIQTLSSALKKITHAPHWSGLGNGRPHPLPSCGCFLVCDGPQSRGGWRMDCLVRTILEWLPRQQRLWGQASGPGPFG